MGALDFLILFLIVWFTFDLRRHRSSLIEVPAAVSVLVLVVCLTEVASMLVDCTCQGFVNFLGMLYQLRGH